jgi:hypothetical protein
MLTHHYKRLNVEIYNIWINFVVFIDFNENLPLFFVKSNIQIS